VSILKRALAQCRKRAGLRKQDVKAFLHEMMVIGEHVREALAAHGLHGDAIRQAILLIQAGSVKREGIEKRGMALWNHGHVWIVEDIAYGLYRVFPYVRSGSAIEGKVLSQDFVNGIEMVITERPAERQDARMPLGVRW
jgi:hypothetical protein